MKNGYCGVGVAFEASICGVRILSGALTHADEAAAVNYGYQTTHIYSCSWGPRDDGRTLDGGPQIVREAFEHGIQYGRQGLGSIFVFAVGNGGSSGDNCNFDGYTNSPYTITVSAMKNDQKHLSYSEECSATMISMYTGSIYTTDTHMACTSSHGGTSAAAPLASGIFALIYQIRQYTY